MGGGQGGLGTVARGIWGFKMSSIKCARPPLPACRVVAWLRNLLLAGWTLMMRPWQRKARHRWVRAGGRGRNLLVAEPLTLTLRVGWWRSCNYPDRARH